MKKILAYLLLSATSFGYLIDTDINQKVQKDANKINLSEYKPSNRTYVKVFSSENMVALESLINDFIKDKEVIDIQFQLQMEQRFVRLIYSALIIYKY